MKTEFDGIEQYLEYIGRCRGSDFGRRFRRQFRDTRGTAELALLAAPSEQEFQALQRVIACMTAAEKQHPELLADEQMQEIARRAQAEPGMVGIFINGYVLACRRSQNQPRE